MRKSQHKIGSEFDLIDWIRQQATSRDEVLLGIGDDTAILKSTDRPWLTTVDSIAEGTHFTLETATPQQIGRKALAINLSDIAAMAGEPVAAFVSFHLPKHLGRTFIEGVYEGLFGMAKEFNTVIAGGDTNTWDGPFVISITLMGQAHGKGSVLRSGAQVGDAICVTGELGGSLPSKHHLDFTPRVHEAQRLRDSFEIHAMIDVSDGVASDLRHILNASDVGAVIDAEHIPISNAVDEKLPHAERVRHALCDGEDFELLFTVSPDECVRLLADPPFDLQVHRIGEIAKSGYQLRNGHAIQDLRDLGWVHQL